VKKIAIIIFGLVLFLGAWAGCSNGSDVRETTCETLYTNVQMTSNLTETATTEPYTTSLEDVSINFPEEIVVHTGVEDNDYGFQRHYRMRYYGLSKSIVDFAPQKEYEAWVDNELKPYSGIEPTEPHIFSFIKKFNVPFEVLEQEAKENYLSNNDLHDEEYENDNPYLLYTFNLERINDYYSLDPARYASAKQWLEEWLLTNQPYESWSAFQASQR